MSYPMKEHWAPGDIIVLRDALTTRGTRSYEHIFDDHTPNLPGWPYIVLKDTAEMLVLYLPEGTQMRRWNIEQRRLREPRITHGDSVRLFFPGKSYAVDMFYETGSGPAWFVRNFFFSPGEPVRGGTPVVLPEGTHFERGHFYGWKVDMIAPFSRTELGIDVCDEVLDIVVKPDRSYLWIDTAEMEELVAKGIYSQAESDRLYEAGREVFRLIETGASPFDDEWIGCRPGPDILDRGIPELPEGWQFIALADSEWGRIHASVEAAKRGNANQP